MGIGSWLGMVFGLSIPAILLMYLLKRKFIDTLVPSHLLWERVLRNIEANRPWQKLQSRLLLWLQLIVAALLVFALMQPYGWVSDNAKGHVVIVADTSGSMSAKTAEPDAEGEHSNQEMTRMDLLKSQVKDYLKDHAKGSEITLLSMDSEPQVILSREKSHTRVEEALDGLQPYYGKSAYQETISLASALTRDEQDAEVIVFTDGQWKGDGEGISFQVPSRVIDIEASPLRNIAIKQFGVQHQSTGSTAVAVLESTVGETRPIEYSVYGDDQLLVTQTADWHEDGTATLRLEHLQDAEVYRLELHGVDAYEADNTSFAFSSKSSTPRVLFLSSGNLFLEKALQLTGAEITKMIIQGTGSDAPMQEDGEMDMSSPPVPKEAPDLIIVDGDIPNFVSKGEWEKLLSKTPLWTIGGIGKEVKVGGEKAKLHNHEMTKYLSLSGIYFGAVLERDDPDWGDPIIEIGSKPAVYAGKLGGHSRLSFLFKLEDTDLPLSAEFPIMVNNAVSWLTSGEGYGLGRVIAGGSLDIPISAEVTKAQWVAQGGLALSKGIDPIDADQGLRGYTTLQKTPAVPGLYAFEQQDAEGNKSSYWVDVAADPFEGAIGEKTALSFTQEITDSKATMGEAEQNDRARNKADEGQVPMSLMWIVAAAALVIMLLEWGVYQRGRSI
ncbi:vWA domain-containing protein [Paenibacillus sp. FA6]|uniref:vWA domain-containing protein n=1 Tax=Paenibacillus sp. FA6 TaxID=3413029 RepID=UPI003F6583A0